MTALLTEAAAAEQLGIAPRTLRAIRAAGLIRYVRPTPRKVYYRAEDVADYLAAHTRQETPACPSTSPPKAVGGNTTSKPQGAGIMDRLAARPGGMPKGMKLISGGKSH